MDERVASEIRPTYRPLSTEEEAYVRDFKELGAQFLTLLHGIERIRGANRELDISKERMQEAVFWAVHHITG